MLLIKKGSDGIYTSTVIGTLPSDLYRSDLSTDRTLLAASCYFGQLWVIEKNGTTYITKQIINHSFLLSGIKFSQDKKEIFVGANQSSLLIYKDSGSSFTLNQTIHLGFRVMFINHIPNKLEVHGVSSAILFFEYDGNQYILAQNITTQSTSIGGAIRSENFSNFLFGGYSLNMRYYQDRNGTY